MRSFHYGKKQKILWGLFLVAAWSTVIVLFLRHNGGFSAQELAHYQPDRPLLSCLVMLGLFALKSVDFLIHSGVLYAANGIMFPLPLALLLNTVGIMITVIPAYFLGKIWGPSVIETLCRKYPKLRIIADDQKGGSLAVAILLRTVGLPIQVGSVYMGAANFRFGRFLLGSVLGLLPIMIPYTIMGESAGKIGSPAFVIALATEILLHFGSVLIFAVIAKRRMSQKTAAVNES